jgi:hypothetical protein
MSSSIPLSRIDRILRRPVFTFERIGRMIMGCFLGIQCISDVCTFRLAILPDIDFIFLVVLPTSQEYIRKLPTPFRGVDRGSCGHSISLTFQKRAKSNSLSSDLVKNPGPCIQKIELFHGAPHLRKSVEMTFSRRSDRSADRSNLGRTLIISNLLFGTLVRFAFP